MFLRHHQKTLLLRNTFKVALHYFFIVFIHFKTVSYLKSNFKLKIESKMFTFKTWKKFGKPRKIFGKMSGNPVFKVKKQYFVKM